MLSLCCHVYSLDLCEQSEGIQAKTKASLLSFATLHGLWKKIKQKDINEILYLSRKRLSTGTISSCVHATLQVTLLAGQSVC